MRKVLFVYKHKASWALQDIDLIKSFSELREIYVTKKTYLHPIKILKDIMWSDIVFCWFGSFYFFPILIFAKILKKKIFLVSGGYDVAWDKEINHGAFAENLISQFLRRQLFKLIDKVLAVSESIANEAHVNAKVPKEKVEVVHLGFNLPRHEVKPWEERREQVVMIANVSMDKVKVKGIDQFFDIAANLPQYKFVLVGNIAEDSEHMFSILPENIEVTGALEFDGEEFNRVIGESKIAIQLSHYEGFGASIVEAAIRGCYPVVYSQFGLNEVIIDEMGVKVDYGDIEKLSKVIDEKMKMESFKNELSVYYLNQYSINNRVQKLQSILSLK